MAERPHPKKIEVNGTELHYIEQGEGDPLVFVHGGLGDFRTWRPQLGPFSARYHVVSYSRRSHYPNPLDEDFSGYSMDTYVADLAGLIEGLRLGQVRIVANSYGGYISLLLALRQPELVRAMVLAEPPVHPLLRRLPDGEEMFQAFMDSAWRPAGRAFKSGDLEGGVRLFVEGAVGKGEFDRLPPGVREAMMKDAPALAMDTMTEFSVYMPELTCEDAARIGAPTLLLRGELSPRMYYLINNELARCMPHAEQALIPNASHVLHSHNSEEHNRVALEFLMRETET